MLKPPPNRRNQLLADHNPHSPQTSYCLRTDNVNPCEAVLLPSTNQRIVHKLITHPQMPFPHLAFKNCFPETHQGVCGFQALVPWTPCWVPCYEHCTLLHHKLGSVDWLYCSSGGPRFGSGTAQLAVFKQ